MPLRMLRYMLRVWDRWVTTKRGRGFPLPPIVSVVLSHDEGGWRSARSFGELFPTDSSTRAELGRFIPDFDMVIDDLAKLDDEALAARNLPPEVALSIWALRDGRSPNEVLAHAVFWAPVVAALDGNPAGPTALQRIFEYLGEAAGERSTDLELLVATIAEHTPAARDVTMNSLEKLLDKGRKEGREGALLEGEQNMLLKQLRHKFGELTELQIARVREADEATLDHYAERAVTADSIEAVLGTD